MQIAERALDMIPDGADIGLGSGRAATVFIQALGQRVRDGLRVRGVPTSEGTADLARKVGIPLTTLEEALPLHLTVDGADEVDPQLNLIKGLGGALVREKIVAAASRRLIIVVGAEKLVRVLGDHKILPVEVVPFSLALCRRRLQELGYACHVRQAGDRPFVTDNGNVILDCAVSAIGKPAELEQQLRSIPGVVGTGLFLGMADTVLIQDGDSVQVRQRTSP